MNTRSLDAAHVLQDNAVARSWAFAREHGLSTSDLGVLHVLTAELGTESEQQEHQELTVMLSVSQIATKLSTWDYSRSEVQRSINKLASLGLIARRQRDKRNRDVAFTTIMPAALLSDGRESAVSALPVALAKLLIGESRAFVTAVNQAYHQSRTLHAREAGEFRGVAADLAQIEQLLHERVGDTGEAILDAITQVEQRELDAQMGICRFALEDQSVAVIDLDQLHASTPVPCDIALALEALRLLQVKRPGLITRTSLPRLLAEALYSRHIGFANIHDAEDAIRIIAATMARPTWSRPYSIRDTWYEATQASIGDARITYPQADHFSFASN